MVTIVTAVELKEGAEQEWDAVMRERLDAARKREGWIGGQLLRPEDRPDARVIVGTWRTKDDWEKWHEDPEFAHTRRELEGLTSREAQHSWHEVVSDMRRAGGPSAGSRARASGQGPRRMGESRMGER
jgi:heme-degrading monooxygenase HmoA